MKLRSVFLSLYILARVYTMKSDIIQTKIRAEMYVHVYSVYTVALKKWSLVQYAVCIV